ncbi:MAG TPA: histidine phosphatase family protein [Terriglobales bacterium]|nr:histidine phosphatase family protein [Terriglobales bacterium]
MTQPIPNRQGVAGAALPRADSSLANRQLLLIEHGQTRFDRRHRVHGFLDPPLNPEGRRQAARLGLRLAGLAHPPSRIFTSDRRRAAETARIAGAIAGIPVTATPALRPLNVGRFSGQDQRAVARRLQPYFAEPERRIPGGESVGTWRRRHLAFVRGLAAAARGAAERPALLTHSNVIESLGGGAHPRSAQMLRVSFPSPGFQNSSS